MTMQICWTAELLVSLEEWYFLCYCSVVAVDLKMDCFWDKSSPRDRWTLEILWLANYYGQFLITKKLTDYRGLIINRLQALCQLSQHLHKFVDVLNYLKHQINCNQTVWLRLM